MPLFSLYSVTSFHRSQEARTRIEAVCAFCSCERCGHLWSGADDGSVPYCAGLDFHDYERRRLRGGSPDGIAVRDCDGG